MSMRRRTTARVTVERGRGVFMISVAAELADMHPQTLRMYEARGLIEPQRSPKGTRLYSQEDVERLRRIQEMTSELGLNLAGVERVLELEEQLERATRRLESLERRSAEMRAEMEAEIERVRKSFKAEIVPYKSGTDLIRAEEVRPARRSIRVERDRDGR
jgi:MerR family transcriptional regulator, heat shock protein HspR